MDRSLQQLGVDYVDVFYHHAPDPSTPQEETVGALDEIVRSGKARYAGISNYSPAETRSIAALFKQAGTPFFVHQCNYHMLNRWVEDELLDTLAELGMGAAIFASLGQGLLANRSIGGPAPGSRAAGTLGALVSGVAEGEPAYGRYPEGDVEAHVLHILQELGAIAKERGQTLSQLAVAWVLRHPVVSTVIVGTSDVNQLRDTIGATEKLEFTDDELARIEAIIPPRM
jgi:L-glyceraldehyde 3-phosphate reductase